MLTPAMRSTPPVAVTNGAPITRANSWASTNGARAHRRARSQPVPTSTRPAPKAPRIAICKMSAGTFETAAGPVAPIRMPSIASNTA